MKTTFEGLAEQHGGRLCKARAVELLKHAANGNGGSEAAELLWAEMGLAEDAFITEVLLLSSAMLCVVVNVGILGDLLLGVLISLAVPCRQ